MDLRSTLLVLIGVGIFKVTFGDQLVPLSLLSLVISGPIV